MTLPRRPQLPLTMDTAVKHLLNLQTTAWQPTTTPPLFMKAALNFRSVLKLLEAGATPTTATLPST